MISEMIHLVNGEHYLALVLVMVLSCILMGRNIRSERVNQSSFWLTVVVCALLIVQDLLENYAQLDAARRDMRMITSIAGYALRPVAVLGFLLVVWPSGRKRWFLWIPAILNALLYSSALFSPLAFTFNENYSFSRGPLGWIMFPVCLLYLIMALVVVHIRFRERRAGDMVTIYACTLGCLGAMAVDVRIGDITIISAVLISSMTFYLFLRAQDTDHDPLTRLWNRMTFYEDCRKYRSAVSAVVSIDMNGLKKTNDELGHAAGDRALKTIGRNLRQISSRKIIAYRIGGDEFMLLFLHCNEDEAQIALNAFLESTWEAGLSVAVGLAVRTESGESMDELIHLSDQHMYQDKSMYYQYHDRRSHR